MGVFIFLCVVGIIVFIIIILAKKSVSPNEIVGTWIYIYDGGAKFDINRFELDGTLFFNYDDFNNTAGIYTYEINGSKITQNTIQPGKPLTDTIKLSNNTLYLGGRPYRRARSDENEMFDKNIAYTLENLSDENLEYYKKRFNHKPHEHWWEV